jgi:hypothetical protein
MCARANETLLVLAPECDVAAVSPLVRLGFAVSTALSVTLLDGCGAQPSPEPARVSTPSIPPPPPEPASSPSTPAPRLPPPIRFGAGVPAPQLGCFAWSPSKETYACVVGHAEPEPDGMSTLILFIEKEGHSKIALERGLLTEANRTTLDARMVEGDYRYLGPPEWTSSETPTELAGFVITMESERFRVEREGKVVHESIERSLPRYRPTCSGRAWSTSSGILLERTCRVMDEGIGVYTTYVYACDTTRCR